MSLTKGPFGHSIFNLLGVAQSEREIFFRRTDLSLKINNRDIIRNILYNRVFFFFILTFDTLDADAIEYPD